MHFNFERKVTLPDTCGVFTIAFGRYVQWDHLAAAHAAVASLRRMSVSGTTALANSDGELTLPELSSVEVLEVSCFPRRALLTLIRAHRLKLRELRLCVGTGGCVDR